jgi:PAS domain-containing protein
MSASIERFLVAIHPKDRARADETVQNSFRERSQYYVEIRTLWSAGTIRWIVSRGRTVCDEAGEPTSMMGIAADITDRKAVEDQLRISEGRLRLAMEAAGLGTWDEDLHSRQSVWNEQAFRIFDYEPQTATVTPDRWLSCVLPEDRARVSEAYAKKLLPTIPCMSMSIGSCARMALYVGLRRMAEFSSMPRDRHAAS